ncbi:hypothetical protein BC835DRAFT_1269541 [Cytidiella melzeri]|nr:hypothetical protein BC835DRAFT_1269541 [Cytidiella melzeri]
MSSQAPPCFSVDVNGMMETSSSGIAAIRGQLAKQRKEMREEKARCGNSACDKEEGGKTSLRACSRCHSVRYCSTKCQRDHWPEHKQSCQSFVDPPLCRTFNPKHIPTGCKYPATPIFSRGDKDGVGCWCAPNGQITCDLSVKPGGALDNLPSNSTTPEDLMSMLPGVPGFYLDLRMMIQNRTKAAKLVVGKEIIAVVSEDKQALFLEGRKPGEKHVPTAVISGASSVGLYPSYVRASNFNGKEVEHKGLLPAVLSTAMQDAKSYSLVLQPAEYVILDLQYRLGGPTIDKDFKAWGLLDHFVVPSIKHDPNIGATYHDLYSPDGVSKIRATVYQRVVDYWYGDYVAEGEYAHIVSHHGEARANMIGKGMEVMGQHLKMMMGMMLQGLGGGRGMPGI